MSATPYSPAWKNVVAQAIFRSLRPSVLCFVAILLSGIHPVFGADLKSLPGHVPQVVSSLVPQNRLSATNELWLAIGLPMRDRAGLENFVTDVSDPHSLNFRHFLTREEVTARFGPTEQDYEAVKKFAVTNGLAIKVTPCQPVGAGCRRPASGGRKSISYQIANLPASDRSARFLCTGLRADGRRNIAGDGCRRLDRFIGCPIRKRQQAKNRTPHPKELQYGSAPDGSGDLFCDDFRNAYVPGTTLTGVGQSVGLVEFDGYLASDVFDYADQAGDGRANIELVTALLDNFSGNPQTVGGEEEVEGDIEMVMAIAPGLAQIVTFEAKPTSPQNDVLNAMLNNSNVLNLSCSWSWYDGPSNTTDAIFMSMDAVGQTFFNASGDNGAFMPV